MDDGGGHAVRGQARLVEGAAREDGGVHGVGEDRLDADAVGGGLFGEGAGQAGDGELGRAVRPEPGHRQLAAHRADLDDRPATLPAQYRQGSLGDVHYAIEIGLDLLAEILFRHILNRRQVAVPGIVDQHIQTAKRS